MSARKIGFLILLLAFGGIVEVAWHVRESHFVLGPEGFRVLGGRFYGPSFAFEDSVEHTLETDGALEVEVRNEFGEVRVLPGSGPTVQVKLRKVVFQPTEEKARAFADRIELRLEEEDGRLRVGTNRDDVGREENVGFETHLEIHVPAEAEALIWNDHGRVEARGIAGAYVRASFDDVRVERIAGPVQIDARQGAVGVADLGAELTLKSRHGDVEIVGVAGPADLDVQHGRLNARRTGAVEAKVSHGFVAAEAVEGDLRVEARHTGARVADVSGRVEIRTSYEDVRLERIGGSVQARVDRGAVRAKDVKGPLTAEATHDGVWLEGIEGRVEVTTRRGGVTAENLGGGVHVRSRGDDVSIDGFRGPVTVEAEGGDVALTTRTPISEAVTVSAKEGAVRLEVPAGSRIALETESRGGDLHLDVPELERAESATPGRATGRIGGGGARVKLTADGDVTVAAGPVARPAEKP